MPATRPARGGGVPRRALARLAADRRGGASSLATRGLDILAASAREWSRRPATAARRNLRATLRAWVKVQPAMGFFRGSSPDLVRIVRGREHPGVALASWVRSRVRDLQNETPRLAREVRQSVPPHARILTISRSRQVRDSLVRLPMSRRPRRVDVLVSRPGGEGRGMARDLARAGLRTRVVPDQPSRPSGWDPVDLVLLGSDAVLADGSLVHKTGTRRVCRWAHSRGIPVLVLAGRSKFVAGRRPPRLSRWFDRTPPGWIDWYLTDRGRWSPTRVARVLRVSPKTPRPRTTM